MQSDKTKSLKNNIEKVLWDNNFITLNKNQAAVQNQVLFKILNIWRLVHDQCIEKHTNSI